MSEQRVAVIGCGGLGANIATLLAEKGIEVSIFDSADSNIRNHPELKESFYCVPTVDGDDGSSGSGKDRKLNAKEYREFIKESIPKIPHADVTIIVTSLGGGTGSSLSPMLTHALKKRGDNVVVAALAVTESLKTTENTINTLSDFAKIALQTDVGPVHLLLEEDDESLQPSVIDKSIVANILNVIRAAGGYHHGLDKRDVTNWLDYRHLGIAAGLSLIERYDDLEALAKVEGAITRLSLIADRDTRIPDIGVVSNADGITNDGLEDMHFIISALGMEKFRAKLDSRRSDLIAARDALNNRSNVFVEEESELDFL